MFIKSMTLDGFKSYGQRTEITGFDRSFNAITGLNGSGKSNILDAICFLLGITNLSHVRATNLQELIYKNGQAGIQKATVSIIFDNLDKAQSPVGYESYDTITVTRQIVLGGRNKYLINACNATNSRVQDLFGSVQLNVNNPHFLIMQGRVTKVLNMKPPEILLMIEEAAGTRMYEAKKQAAERTIEKKDQKLKEIETILAEEIGPQLERLKAERQSYMAYTKTIRVLEHLTKVNVAWKYLEATKYCDRAVSKLDELQKSIEEHKRFIDHLGVEKVELEKQINILEQQKDEQAGGELADLEKNHKDFQMVETKAFSDINHIKENLKAENKRMKDLEKNLIDDEKAVVTKNKDLENLLSKCEGIIAKGLKDTDALSAAQKHFQALSTGLSSNKDGDAATLADQLMTAKSEIANSESQFKQSELKLKHAENEINKKRDQCTKTETAYRKDEQSYSALMKNVGELKKQLDKIGFDEKQLDDLISRKQQAQRDLNSRRDEFEIAESRVPNLTFQYQNPYSGFDRSKVHGFIARVIKLKNPETATALELTAGGRLYNVVVDNEETSKALIQKGQLRQRYTMIPLNKIVGYNIDKNIVEAAQKLVGQDNVWPAISLIEYEKVLEPAMKYAFGGTFICRTMDQAKKVAYHPNIMRRAISLDGDIFDPSGTLTGGYIAKGASVLLKVSTLKDLEAAVAAKGVEIRTIEQSIGQLSSKKENFDVMKKDFDAKEGEAENVKARMQSSSHQKLMDEVQELEAVIKDHKENFQRTSEMKKKMEDKVKELELKLKDSKGYRERDLKLAEEELAKCKKEFDSSNKQAQERQAEVDSMKLEIQELQNSVETDQVRREEVIATIQSLNDDIKQRTENMDGIRNNVKTAMELITNKRTVIQAQSKEINHFRNQKTANEDQQSQRELRIKEVKQEILKKEKDSTEAVQKVQYMLSRHSWIETEKQYFGVPNTEYDFKVTDPKEAGHRIKKLEETKEKLEKNVNMRAQNLMSKTEQDFNELIRKKQVVLNDKLKIEATIKELDEQKKIALIKAYEKVNKDFGSIFSLLLLNAQAKLIPVEGKSVLDGLEVKVGFNNTWKDSLNELSGGQRSLVALSLILAMLLFKPAPIYILDEVDAALDLSHTQNIGQMLRTHFKSSQFIIVSLKDGMFNNANVLFRTKFIDGTSAVTRSVQQSSK